MVGYISSAFRFLSELSRAYISFVRIRLGLLISESCRIEIHKFNVD